MLINQELKRQIESFKSMLRSCFCYGGIDKNRYSYERYLYPYKEKLGEKVFNKVYKEHRKYLEENYTILTNTHTDSEGLTYNSLVKINK